MIMPPVRKITTLVTSNYGKRIRNRRIEYHNGVDLRTVKITSSREELQKIVVTEDCTIIDKGVDKLGNTYLRLRPLVSYWLTEIIYVHVDLSDIRFIGHSARRLSAGTALGYSELGGNSTGHHLHFSIKNFRGYANPIHDYFIPNGIKYKFK